MLTSKSSPSLFNSYRSSYCFISSIPILPHPHPHPHPYSHLTFDTYTQPPHHPHRFSASSSTRTKRPNDISLPHRSSSSQIPSTVDTALSLNADGLLHHSDLPLFNTLSAPRAHIFSNVLRARTRRVTIVCDDVNSPHNLAAITRTCDAWGIQDIHFISYQNYNNDFMSSIQYKLENDTTVHAVSKKTHRWLTLYQYQNVTDVISKLKNTGYTIIVSSLWMPPQTVHVNDVMSTVLRRYEQQNNNNYVKHQNNNNNNNNTDLVENIKLAFVFGSESNGVSPQMSSVADIHFTIPMYGFAESLNVSVAVASTFASIIPNLRNLMSSTQFFLQKEEAMNLASHWLQMGYTNKNKNNNINDDQFKTNDQNDKKQLHSKTNAKSIRLVRGDVTRLGHDIELRILNQGLFSHPSIIDTTTSDTETISWKNILRFRAHTGQLLTLYVHKRKFGALGDIQWQTRCKNITYYVAGSSALSCASTLKHLTLDSHSIPRSMLFDLFKTVCDTVHAEFHSLFDRFGFPMVPGISKKGCKTFDECHKNAVRKGIREGVKQMKDRIFNEGHREFVHINNLNTYDACNIIINALTAGYDNNKLDVDYNIRNILQTQLYDCITNKDNYNSLITILPTLQKDVSDNDNNHSINDDDEKIICLSNVLTIIPSQNDNMKTNQNDKAIMAEICSRITQVALLAADVHMAVWDRARNVSASGTTRLRKLTHSFLEGVVVDSFAHTHYHCESQQVAVLRSIKEVERLIEITKWALEERREEDRNDQPS